MNSSPQMVRSRRAGRLMKQISLWKIPFRFESQVSPARPIGAFVHCFYPEVLPLILQRLENIPGAVDLYLSTDPIEKKSKSSN